MKKTVKFPSLRPLLICLFLIATLLIIHSCRKEAKLTPLSAADSVSLARTWYENNYPVSVNSNGGVLSQYSVNRAASNSAGDYSPHIKPDWVHNVSYRRFNKAVIEAPVDASAPVAFALKNNNKNKIVYSNEDSKTSFIILKDGAKYSAFVMVIMGDKSYSHGDKAKLARNTYRHREADFSGMVLYFTPNGQFVRSYLYKNGKMIVPSKTANTPRTLVVAAVDCTDWYLVTDYYDGEGNFYLETASYIYTTCDDGGGGPGGPGGGGSPSDPQQPCNTAGGSSNDALKVKILKAAPQDPGDGGGSDNGGGGDPGFPDPTQSTCAEPEPDDPPIVDSCALNGLLSSSPALASKLTSLTSHFDDPYESGYQFTDPSNPSSYVAIPGQVMNPYLNVSVTGQIAGIIHVHTDSIKNTSGQPVLISPVPTGEDFQIMYTLLKGGNMIDPTTFINTVVTPTAVCNLQIIDPTLFASWAATNLTAPNANTNSPFQTAVDKSYYDYYNNQFLPSDLAHELALLDNLPGTGIMLSVASPTNMSSFNAAKSVNGTVVLKKCN